MRVIIKKTLRESKCYVGDHGDVHRKLLDKCRHNFALIVASFHATFHPTLLIEVTLTVSQYNNTDSTLTTVDAVDSLNDTTTTVCIVFFDRFGTLSITSYISSSVVCDIQMIHRQINHQIDLRQNG